MQLTPKPLLLLPQLLMSWARLLREKKIKNKKEERFFFSFSFLFLFFSPPYLNRFVSVISYFVVVVLARSKANPAPLEHLSPAVPAPGGIRSPPSHPCSRSFPNFFFFLLHTQACLPPLESHLCTLELRGYLLVS